MGLKKCKTLVNYSFVIFLFIFLIPYTINKKNKWDLLLYTTVFVVIFLHLFYFEGSTRYYYESFFALSLVTAHGVNLSDITFNKLFPTKPVKKLNYLFLLFIIIANIFIIISPLGVVQRYKSYKQSSDPFNLVKERNLSNTIVFLKSVPGKDNKIHFYIQNPPNFDGGILYALDLEKKIKY